MNTGVTFAIFRGSRNIPVCRNKSKTYPRISLNSTKQILIKLKDILLALILLFIYKEKKTSFNWFIFGNLSGKVVLAFFKKLSKPFPANISTLDQCCFNVVDQRWNNVYPTLKMKQNPTSDFQSCRTLIRRQCPTLKQRWNNVTQRWNNVAQRLYNVDTTLFHPSIDIS